MCITYSNAPETPDTLVGRVHKNRETLQTSIQDPPVSNLSRSIGYFARRFYSGRRGKFMDNTSIRL
jgi:hypothetical protein